MLGAAEKLSEFVVSRQRGVFDIGLQPQHIAQAGFGEPDDVVVLVPGPSDIAKLGVASHSSPSLICLSSSSRPPTTYPRRGCQNGDSGRIPARWAIRLRVSQPHRPE